MEGGDGEEKMMRKRKWVGYETWVFDGEKWVPLCQWQVKQQVTIFLRL